MLGSTGVWGLEVLDLVKKMYRRITAVGGNHDAAQFIRRGASPSKFTRHIRGCFPKCRPQGAWLPSWLLICPIKRNLLNIILPIKILERKSGGRNFLECSSNDLSSQYGHFRSLMRLKSKAPLFTSSTTLRRAPDRMAQKV